MSKKISDWATNDAAQLVRAYGCFPQQGSGDEGEARTIRVIAAALRKAAKDHGKT